MTAGTTEFSAMMPGENGKSPFEIAVARLQKMSAEEQRALMPDIIMGPRDNESIKAATQNYVEAVTNVALVDHAAGNMNATAVGQDMAMDLSIAEQQREAGLAVGITPDALALLTDQVRNRVAQMIAAGASDEEIRQAVGSMPGVTVDTINIAMSTAEAQISTDKFNMLSTRNQEQQQQEQLQPVTLTQLLGIEKAEPVKAVEGLEVNPLAKLLAGLTISEELRNLNAPGSIVSANLTIPGKERDRDAGMGGPG